MTQSIVRAVAAVSLFAAGASAASAQSVGFERAYPVSEAMTVDVQTLRGRIDVQPGSANEVRVIGRVSVRTGWNVPANALELARAIASAPPIEQDGRTLRLRPPADAPARDALTVAYDVRVPPGAALLVDTDSGAVTVSGMTAPVNVRTQSSEITLHNVRGGADVRTGFGAVTVTNSAGGVRIGSQSSAITARNIDGDLSVETGSGRVHATLAGAGDVDVHTESSAITIVGAAGGLAAHSESGAVEITGAPSKSWRVSTGSSAVLVHLGASATAHLDATTGSGSITVSTALVDGTIEKRRVSGAIRGGVLPLQITSRSGSIRIQ